MLSLIFKMVVVQEACLPMNENAEIHRDPAVGPHPKVFTRDKKKEPAEKAQMQEYFIKHFNQMKIF